jgi:ferredoxin
VRKVRSRAPACKPGVIDAEWLREVCLAAGADDVAFASVDNRDLTPEREHVETALPGTKLISLVVRMNREDVRSPARSVANQEFHRSGEPSATFPMEMDKFPGRIWVVGNFILLATLLVDAEITRYGEPLDYSPCLECKLCVAACPVGAIGKDGDFDFAACSVHNYREFMGGFTDWARARLNSVLGSAIPRILRCGRACRSRPTTRQHTAWRCIRRARTSSAVPRRPQGFHGPGAATLQEKKETLYVLPNSAAKAPNAVSPTSGCRPSTAASPAGNCIGANLRKSPYFTTELVAFASARAVTTRREPGSAPAQGPAR